MIKLCHKCKDCHSDMTIEKALGTLHTDIVYKMDHFDSNDDGEICMMYRQAAAYQFIVDTLKEHGLIDKNH